MQRLLLIQRRQPALAFVLHFRSDVDLLCPLSTPSLATGQAFTIAAPDHASVIRKSNKLQKEAATAPEASGGGRCRRPFNLCFPVERPVAGLVKKKNRICGATQVFAPLPASASEKIQLCHVAAGASTLR